MHSKRKQAVALTVVMFFSTSVVISACFREASPFAIVLLALFAAITGACSLMVLTPDRWYRFVERAEKQAERKHTVTKAILTVLALIASVAFLIRLFGNV